MLNAHRARARALSAVSTVDIWPASRLAVLILEISVRLRARRFRGRPPLPPPPSAGGTAPCAGHMYKHKPGPPRDAGAVSFRNAAAIDPRLFALPSSPLPPPLPPLLFRCLVLSSGLFRRLSRGVHMRRAARRSSRSPEKNRSTFALFKDSISILFYTVDIRYTTLNDETSAFSLI